MTTLWDDLVYRGLVHQVTNEEGLRQQMERGRVTLYVGFDPTADSLHIGSLLPILVLRRFQLAGHIPIPLVGGATGLIGDPSGKANERTLNDFETVADWSLRIRTQLERFLDFAAPTNSAAMANNFDWTHNLGVIGFLRDIGKNFSLNYMLAKDSVESRLERGISFTEFSYMILQAYDFLNLYRQYGCRLQVGGSDQWGNITAGLELIRKVENEEGFGLTLPLVTKSDGTKFGKTESGTIWLDSNKTSPYQFYQFWLNADDRDVVQYLKYFTFFSKDEIEALAVEVEQNPGARAAQRALARAVTTLVHGEQATVRADQISDILFRGNIQELSVDDIRDAFQDVPSARLASGETPSLVDLLTAVGACPSKRQAREDIRNGAISINGERMADPEFVVSLNVRIGGEFVVVRRGKKSYFLARFTDKTN